VAVSVTTDDDDGEEQLFSILRTMGHGRNFDLLQLEERIGHAMQVAEVYSRHPEWDRGSRRLSL